MSGSRGGQVGVVGWVGNRSVVQGWGIGVRSPGYGGVGFNGGSGTGIGSRGLE